jgi:GNAT superfamily N-acetyltransferase
MSISSLSWPASQTQRADRDIVIRRARRSDWPAIEEFLDEAYAGLAPYKGRARWVWQFADNPYGDSRTDDMPVWIAETCEKKVVGQIAVQPGSLKVDDKEYDAGWIVDVMILPSHRGLKIGHRLYDAVAQDCEIVVTLTMAEATRRMAERVGAVNVTRATLYSRPVRFDGTTVRRYLLFRTQYHPKLRSVAGALCKYFFAGHLIAGVGNAAVVVRSWLSETPKRRPDTSIEEVRSFDAETDAFWQRVRHEYPVAFVRTSKFLNWRFFEPPDLRYRCFVARREGAVVGYVVLRTTEPVELPQGIIVDLFASREDRETIRDLAAFALEYFNDKRVASLSCATSIPEFAEVFREFGFSAGRVEKPNCVASDPGLRQRLQESSAEWLFSKADHDWDQIQLA